MGRYREPWIQPQKPNDGQIFVKRGEDYYPRLMALNQHSYCDENIQLVQRSCDCVNALEGVENPEEQVRRWKRLEAASKETNRQHDPECHLCKNEGECSGLATVCDFLEERETN